MPDFAENDGSNDTVLDSDTPATGTPRIDVSEDWGAAPHIDTPLPPPPIAPDHATEALLAAKRQKVLALAAAVLLAIAVVLGLLWTSANSAKQDAEADRDAALAAAEVDATEARTAADELFTARSDLDAAQAENLRLTDELAAAAAGDATADATTDDASTDGDTSGEDATAELAVLTTANDALNERITELEADLAEQVEATEAAETAAQEAVDGAAGAEPDAEPDGDAGAEPDTTASTPAANAGGSGIEDVPDFARYIGETLSSRSGSSRLAQSQSTCFGTAIVNDIGYDGLGKGLALNASAAENNVVVGAMQRAADTCNIPLELIF